MSEIEKGKIGSSFEDFLHEQGSYADTTEQAVKRVIAYQLEQSMKEKQITKVAMANKLKTSRSQLDRLLDPENNGTTIGTLARAAEAIGMTLRVELH
ncbi:MAG: helix-turn-helix domain-containing protein [Parasphingorhabdus sp.]